MRMSGAKKIEVLLSTTEFTTIALIIPNVFFQLTPIKLRNNLLLQA